MRSLLATCFLVVWPISGFAQSPDVPQMEGSLGAASSSGAYILGWDSPAFRNVTIYSPDAKPVYTLPVFVEHRIEDVWALDCDGLAARVYRGRGKRENGIDFLDAGGKTIRTMDTGFFAPQHLAFAPDHTLWAVGYEDEYDSRGVDFNVIHHYARTGVELGQMLPWSKIAGDYNAYTSLQLCLGGKFLFVTNDRVAFYTHLKYGHSIWIELSTGGEITKTYDLGDYAVLDYHPLAVTASGNVYAHVYKDKQPDGYAVLNKSKGTWNKVHGYPKGAALIGADGENLIFSQHDGGWTRIFPVATSELRVNPSPLQLRAAY